MHALIVAALLYRNIFAFVDHAPHQSPRPAKRGEGVRRPGEGPLPPDPQPAAHDPAPPAFPYRYIGTFGPSASPFAVFTHDGDVVAVRVGETVGGFVLQRIGIESVDVVASTGSVQRVPL